MAEEHQPLPVEGYKPQDQQSVDLVNQFKRKEEELLRWLDKMRDEGPAYDQRWLAIARTSFEQGYMALNRSVFQPKRVSLPEDKAE